MANLLSLVSLFVIVIVMFTLNDENCTKAEAGIITRVARTFTGRRGSSGNHNNNNNGRGNSNNNENGNGPNGYHQPRTQHNHIYYPVYPGVYPGFYPPGSMLLPYQQQSQPQQAVAGQQPISTGLATPIIENGAVGGIIYDKPSESGTHGGVSGAGGKPNEEENCLPWLFG